MLIGRRIGEKGVHSAESIVGVIRKCCCRPKPLRLAAGLGGRGTGAGRAVQAGGPPGPRSSRRRRRGQRIPAGRTDSECARAGRGGGRMGPPGAPNCAPARPGWAGKVREGPTEPRNARTRPGRPANRRAAGGKTRLAQGSERPSIGPGKICPRTCPNAPAGLSRGWQMDSFASGSGVCCPPRRGAESAARSRAGVCLQVKQFLSIVYIRAARRRRPRRFRVSHCRATVHLETAASQALRFGVLGAARRLWRGRR
jgi:hypothetical protein